MTIYGFDIGLPVLVALSLFAVLILYMIAVGAWHGLRNMGAPSRIFKHWYWWFTAIASALVVGLLLGGVIPLPDHTSLHRLSTTVAHYGSSVPEWTWLILVVIVVSLLWVLPILEPVRSKLANLQDEKLDTALYFSGVVAFEWALWYSAIIPPLFAWPWLAVNLTVIGFLWYEGLHRLKGKNRRYAAAGLAVLAGVLFASAADSGTAYWTSTQSTSESASCTGVPFRHHYGTEPVRISDGSCRPEFWHTGHCILAGPDPNPAHLTRYCDIDGRKSMFNHPNRAPGSIRYVATADFAFDDEVRLVPYP